MQIPAEVRIRGNMARSQSRQRASIRDRDEGATSAPERSPAPSSFQAISPPCASPLRREAHTYPWTVMAFLCILVSSRLGGITHQSLWFDEGYTVALCSATNFHEFWTRFGNFTTSEHLQPLYYLFMFFWSRFAGVSDLAMRLPSALFSIGAGIAIGTAVWYLSAGRRLWVLLAFTAYVASSFSLYYGQEARPYALLQLLSFTLLALFLRNRVLTAGQSLSRADQVGFALVTALCVLGSPFASLLVLSLAIADRCVTTGWRRWLATWRLPFAFSVAALAAYLVPALTTMPSFIAEDVTPLRQPLWMNIGYSIYGIVYGITLQPAAGLLRGPDKMHAALAYWPVIVPALLTLLALGCGGFLLLRGTRRLNSLVTVSLLALALYLVLLFGIFGTVGHLNVLPRHASALFALFFLSLAAIGSLASSSHSTLGKAVFVGGLCGWLVLNGVSLLGYFSAAAFRKDDYRASAFVLRGHAQPTFVVSGDPKLLARYGARAQDATEADPDQLLRLVQDKARNASEVILVFNQFRNFRWSDVPQSPIQAMAPRYQCALTSQEANIDLYACHDQTVQSASGGGHVPATGTNAAKLSLHEGSRSSGSRSPL
jgi:hypothetical protein